MYYINRIAIHQRFLVKFSYNKIEDSISFLFYFLFWTYKLDISVTLYVTVTVTSHKIIYHNRISLKVLEGNNIQHMLHILILNVTTQ